jgi:penicillin-binding protein 1C
LLYCSAFVVLALIFARSINEPLFKLSYSPVLYDREGKLLGAQVAVDGQWRFPASEKLNEKFVMALIETEDRRFRRHLGVDPLAIARAAYLNIRHGKVVSGGSTISMQTIRLARGSRRRTFPEKFVEAVLALRLELGRSKDDILSLYAANAPFGANVVGLEAAAWRWFGRSSEELSWAEAATLAVLPNSPALIHPGRNRETL